MAVRKLKEGKTLKNYEIADMLVANGFGNEEEGYLDYFLPDNPKYVASVNLDDMGSYIDDLYEGEHVSLPYANNADRKILRTEEDVEEFLSFIQELNYSDMFESKARKTGNKRSIKEELDDSSYEDLKYEVYRAAERAFNSFVRNNEMNVSDDEITSIMRDVTAKLLDSVIEL